MPTSPKTIRWPHESRSNTATLPTSPGESSARFTAGASATLIANEPSIATPCGCTSSSDASSRKRRMVASMPSL